MKQLPSTILLNYPTTILFFAAACVFLGRAYQYLFFDAPLRVLLWDEKLMTPIVTGWFGRPWQAYATDPDVVERIGWVQWLIGGEWLLAGVACLLLLGGYRRWLAGLIGGGVLLLLLHAGLSMKDHFYHLAQFFEFGIQLVTPLLWVLFARGGVGEERLILLGKVAVAVTFAAHGLYAIGAYPVPGNFVDMTMTILGIGEPDARGFLRVVGLLDLVLAVGIFLPWVDRPWLAYAAVWGLVTALARVSYGWLLVGPDAGHQYACQTVWRLGHGLLPLWLLLRSI